MATQYDPTSIVDLLKSRNMPSDMASRAKLAVDYGLATNPQDYYTKAKTGGVNTALIAQLKGTGGQGGSMASPTAPVNANLPSRTPKTAGVIPTPTTTISPAVQGVQDLLTKTQDQLKQAQGAGYTGSQEIKYDAQGNIIKASEAYPPELTQDEIDAKAREKLGVGAEVYQGQDGNWYNSKTGQVDLAKTQNENQKKIYEKAQNDELESLKLSNTQQEQALLNSLAARGILGTDTQGNEELKRFRDDVVKQEQSVRDKYALKFSDLSAGLKAEIEARIQKEIDKITKDQADRIARSQESQKIAQEAIQQNIENQLKREEMALKEKLSNNEISVAQYNSETSRLKANADIAKTRAETQKIISEMTPQTGETDKGSVQLDLVKNSLARAQQLADASGRSGIRKTAENWLAGSTDYTNLVAETNTLRTNVLTLMTDPTIKKFFGPQMSNADVQLMTSAGTTLNPELQSPANMKLELTRLTDLINRMDSAVKQGTGVGISGTLKSPDGTQEVSLSDLTPAEQAEAKAAGWK